MPGNRLLVIDDDPSFGRLVTKVAAGLGFEVRVTDEPGGFLDLAETWSPSVAMLDLQMPQTDGIELLRALSDRRFAAKIILASGLDNQTLEAAHRLGAARLLKMAGILAKPARVAAVRAALQRCRTGPAFRASTADIAAALADDALFLEYQPKLDCRDGRISGVEALVRWRHPQHGLIRPDQFIPVAEASELIHELTDWVMAAAAQQAASWRGHGLALDVAVNISARNLERIDLPDRLSQRCADHGLPPEAVILELTETAAMRDPVQTADVLTRLRVKGFRLSIDDFGTGYSSLQQLQRLPFSEIKIDQSFVMQMLDDRGARVIVEIIVDLARKLGLHCVAEGVETAAALEALCALGCDGLQGYYLSRPLPPEQVAAFIHDRGEAPRILARDRRPAAITAIAAGR